MKLQLPKGMNDSLPEEKIGKQKLMDELKEIFELYGFSPLETPAIERLDVLSAKYAGGAEILKETFKLKDQGKRDLALRYDLTVPFARVVGMNPQLKMPFKRYQMDKVWRDGPIGHGRYREFWQCDVDMVGTKSMYADAEILSIVKMVFDKFDLDYEIELNNRKILNGILASIGIDDYDKKIEIILTIDKIKKISKNEFELELSQKGLNKIQIERLSQIISTKGSNNEKLSILKNNITDSEGLEGIKELEDLFSYLDEYGLKNYVFEFSLTRGLAFYTGTVFETFLKKGSIKSAVASGGRYDKIIGKFLDSKLEFPCVGISFGMSRIYDAIKERDNLAKKTVTRLFVIPIGIKEKIIPIIQSIRLKGINAETDLVERGISKNLNYANSLEIPYVLFVGEDELKSKKFKLKNMITGEEQVLTLSQVIKEIKN
jgi:histidyl-tRNA synthetase